MTEFIGHHQGVPVLEHGVPAKNADGALLMLHGRGADGADILSLASELLFPKVTYWAPTARNHTWYPNAFTAPIESNEPDLSSALALIDELLDRIKLAGVPMERTAILGFSQGACLTLEYAARNPRRYGAVIAFTGGLIGPEVSHFHLRGEFGRTPIFIGTSYVDPHVPLHRVEESAKLLEVYDADVDLRIYEGMGHTINSDEIGAAHALISNMLTS